MKKLIETEHISFSYEEETGLPLAAKLGAEVYFTTALPSLDLRALAFAKSNYILIEFPTTCHPAGIDETLYAVRQRGYTPILAHVERYPFVTADQRQRPGAGRPHGPLAAKIAGMEPGASALHRLPLDRRPPAKPESRVQQAANPHRPPPAPQQH